MNDQYEMSQEARTVVCIELLEEYRDAINDLINSLEENVALSTRIKKITNQPCVENVSETEKTLEILDIAKKIIENSFKTDLTISKLEEFNDNIQEKFNDLGIINESG